MNRAIRRVGYLILAGLALPWLSVWCIAPHDSAQTLGIQHLERDGVRVEFEARPVVAGGVLSEGSFADLRFRITDSASGKPLSGASPGIRLDSEQPAADTLQGLEYSCKSLVGLWEVEPGVYSSRVKLPPAGRFDVELMLDRPNIEHCFTTQVQPATQQLDFLFEKSPVSLCSS